MPFVIPLGMAFFKFCPANFTRSLLVTDILALEGMTPSKKPIELSLSYLTVKPTPDFPKKVPVPESFFSELVTFNFSNEKFSLPMAELR